MDEQKRILIFAVSLPNETLTLHLREDDKMELGLTVKPIEGGTK